MIPLRDSPRTYRFPLVNIAIIVLNVYVFFHQLSLTDRELYAFVYTYGLIPERFSPILLQAVCRLPSCPLLLTSFYTAAGCTSAAICFICGYLEIILKTAWGGCVILFFIC